MSVVDFPIIVDKLVFSYGYKEILKGISVKFEKNKFYSIIGPNGCGKTTLLKNITRNLEAEGNFIVIDSKDLKSMKSKEIARKLAFVPQNTNIDFEFTAMDVVIMGRSPYLRLFQNEKEEDMEIVRRSMEVTKTWHLRDVNINEISGGERQRVIIARALAQQTGIMLLDEPISMLDIHHQIELMDTVKKLVKEEGITVVAVLHDLNIASQYSDEIIILNGGQVFAKGTAAEVITENNILEVYGLSVQVIKNPITGKPHVIPISSLAV